MSTVFVHVSDIHFGQEKDDSVHIHGDVKQQLIADAKEVISKLPGGSVQGILVTGDITQSGKWAEDEEAGRWLDMLAASIGVEIHRVQMVPGNHDLDRTKLSSAGRQILDHIRAGGTTHRFGSTKARRSGDQGVMNPWYVPDAGGVEGGGGGAFIDGVCNLALSALRCWRF